MKQKKRSLWLFLSPLGPIVLLVVIGITYIPIDLVLLRFFSVLDECVRNS